MSTILAVVELWRTAADRFQGRQIKVFEAIDRFVVNFVGIVSGWLKSRLHVSIDWQASLLLTILLLIGYQPYQSGKWIGYGAFMVSRRGEIVATIFDVLGVLIMMAGYNLLCALILMIVALVCGYGVIPDADPFVAWGGIIAIFLAMSSGYLFLARLGVYHLWYEPLIYLPHIWVLFAKRSHGDDDKPSRERRHEEWTVGSILERLAEIVTAPI